MCNVVQEASDNIALVQSLYNVVQEAPDNIALEKKPVQCCLNTLGVTLHSQKPCVMSKRLLTKFYGKKLGDFYFRPVNVLIITGCL